MRFRFLLSLNVLAAVAAGAWLSTVTAQPAFQVVWEWSGAVTTTSAVVKARVRGTPSDLHLRYGLDRGLQGAPRVPVTGPAQVSANGVATFELTGLTPNTHYYYALADGEGRGPIGQLRTFGVGPMTFQIAAASCAGGDVFSSISNHPVFTAIQDRNPLFFIHMGDFHYSNIGRNDPRLFHRVYDKVLTQWRQANLYRQTPIVYMWDDHDFGPNDSDRTSPSREASRQVYQEVVPHYPLERENGKVGSIQQEFTVGRVRFLVTDLRSERDPVKAPNGAGRSILGERQRAWLDAALARAAADGTALVVWVSTVPWITRVGDKEDGWEPYADERRAIADRIEQLGLTRRMVMLAGDAHMVAFDDGTHSNYTSSAKPGVRGFPVVHAAPLDRSSSEKGGPYSGGVSLRQNQFGWLEFEDDGNTLRLMFTGLDGGGRPLPNMRLRVTCTESGCDAEGVTGGAPRR